MSDPSADLEEVRKAVFGGVGDEPDVYADYDELCRLSGLMCKSLSALEERALSAQQAGGDELARALRDYMGNMKLMTSGERELFTNCADLLGSLAARLAEAERALLVLHVNPGGRSEEEHMAAVRLVVDITARASRARTGERT